MLVKLQPQLASRVFGTGHDDCWQRHVILERTNQLGSVRRTAFAAIFLHQLNRAAFAVFAVLTTRRGKALQLRSAREGVGCRTHGGWLTQQTSGFTIVEIVAAIGVIGLLGTAAIAALLQLNWTAAVSRCYVGAEAAAQNQIERILSQPFPDEGPKPSELTVGTTTQIGVPIYQDPVSGQVLVKTKSATPLSTTVTDLSRVIVPNTPATPLYRVDVVVNFKYRNRTSNVALSTLRTTD